MSRVSESGTGFIPPIRLSCTIAPHISMISYLCKRVSNESRALVHELSELLGREDVELHSKMHHYDQHRLAKAAYARVR